MNWTLIKAIKKARANGLLHLRVADEATRLDCLGAKCAKCCNNLGSPLVSSEEAGNIDPAALSKNKDAIFIRSTDSACSLLKEGLCSIYQFRPSGCGEYPWYNIDGALYFDEGCPGIKHDVDERGDPASIQPFENFLPDTPKFAIRLIKKICTKK
jgi:Fe-S-cluster containining protein